MTVHVHWPDMPTGEPRLACVLDYHQRGFDVAAAEWNRLQSIVVANQEDGRFVTFPGFEWHSRQYGDHNVVRVRQQNGQWAWS